MSITVGSKRLARKRHNLEAAGLTVEEWRSQWDAKRMFLSADGEGGKPWGNETIRVTPHTRGYHVTIRLPSPLAHLSNTPGQTPTYRLSAPIEWHHLHDEWKAQASSDRPVGYRIRLDPDKNRWYIRASWSLAPSEEPPTVEEASASGWCLGIDLNSGHMDGRILDTHGNPVGRPIRKDLPEKGPSTHRLGALREAVSQLVKWPRSQGVTVIAIEKLDFSDIRALGRQRPRGGKAGRTTRRKTCGIPTSKFSHTMASATHRNSMTLVAVDPAYTSRWGARYWKKPLDRSRRQQGDRHQAAAVVIGRRSHGYSEKRKGDRPLCRPEGRHRRAVAQWTVDTTGMAPTGGNDRRERSLVGASTAWADTYQVGAQAFKIVRNAGIGMIVYPKRNG